MGAGADPLDVAWDGGGGGRLLSLREDAVVVRSSRPFAPGSRPTGSLGTGDVLRLKTHRCRRVDTESSDFDRRSMNQQNPAFLIEGRTLDMPRGLKEKLLALLAT